MVCSPVRRHPALGFAKSSKTSLSGNRQQMWIQWVRWVSCPLPLLRRQSCSLLNRISDVLIRRSSSLLQPIDQILSILPCYDQAGEISWSIETCPHHHRNRNCSCLRPARPLAVRPSAFLRRRLRCEVKQFQDVPSPVCS